MKWQKGVEKNSWIECYVCGSSTRRKTRQTGNSSGIGGRDHDHVAMQ